MGRPFMHRFTLAVLCMCPQVAVLLASRTDTQVVRRRGHTLTAVEYCSALYRGLLPVPVWYAYLKGLSGMPAFLATVWSGAAVGFRLAQRWTGGRAGCTWAGQALCSCCIKLCDCWVALPFTLPSCRFYMAHTWLVQARYPPHPTPHATAPSS